MNGTIRQYIYPRDCHRPSPDYAVCVDCLTRMKDMVKPNGYLIITTPFSWLDEFTARENWLGGYEGKVGCRRWVPLVYLRW
jgi:hypothetical protein